MMQASTHVFVILGWHSVLNVSSEPSSGSRLSCPRHGERHRLLVFSSSCVGNKDGKRVVTLGLGGIHCDFHAAGCIKCIVGMCACALCVGPVFGAMLLLDGGRHVYRSAARSSNSDTVSTPTQGGYCRV